MATTLHLGDCANGCQTCADNYHESQAICDTCGTHTDVIEGLYDYQVR